MTQDHFAAFQGHKCLARGDLPSVAVAIKIANPPETVIVLSDLTGKPVDLDLRGSPDEVAARYAPTGGVAPPKARRGRPKLGVLPREVTLLPRHWDWLAGQTGGASAALRRLVEQARRDNSGKDAQRDAQEVAHRALSTLAGDLPNYEEALRAFYAQDAARYAVLIAAWPQDIRTYLDERTAAAWA